MLKVADYARRSEELKARTIETLAKADMQFDLPGDKNEKIRLVFAGQYSAGKSTILKMLTGREDIDIGSGITTQQAHVYEWNGLEVVDTPGIHTQLRPDHDAISYDAIMSADMLVFVITNELFDSHIAEHFRKLAIDRDKAGEMILVVNKMERAAEGNTKAQQDIIREDLRKVLEPYTPEQLHLSFLDAESYLDSLAEREGDPELADELETRSGYAEFIETLNQFVREKEINAKLTTDLYILDEAIDKAVESLQPASNDQFIDALEENYRQQRHAVIEARGRIRQEVSDIFTDACTQIRTLGLEASKLFDDETSVEKINAGLEEAISDANSIMEKCQSDAMIAVDTGMNEIDKQLDDIENSEFSVNLKKQLAEKIDILPEGVKFKLFGAGQGVKKAGEYVLAKGFKEGIHFADAKLGAFAGGKAHELILALGHKIGFKFKPWGAIKLAKGVAYAGAALAVVGIALEAVERAKEEEDEKKREAILKENRRQVRSQFNLAADELENYGKEFVKEAVMQPLNQAVAEIDQNIQELRDTRQNKSETCLKLEKLQKECQQLIRDIHAEGVKNVTIV